MIIYHQNLIDTLELEKQYKIKEFPLKTIPLKTILCLIITISKQVKI